MSNESQLKAWARESMVGVQNITFPSFTPDLSELDEDGIRWDVQQAVRHGFFATLCACETGLTFEESKRFVEIVADEAKGKLQVSVTLLFDSLEKNRAMMEHAQKVGVHTIQLGYPPNYYPEQVEEIYQVAKSFCDDAGDLAVVLYPSPHYNFERFHNSAFPLEVLERLADHPNVVSVEAGEPGLAGDLIARLGDKILVTNPVERMLPLMVQAGKMQYIGPGTYEAYQSPDAPHMVNYFKLLREGKTAEAMEIYWMLAPIRNMFEGKQMSTAMLGCYHWPLLKYYQWLVGGNGGYTRQPCMKLHQHELEPIKFGMMQAGMMPRAADQEFYIGRINAEKAGLRFDPPMPPGPPPGA